MNCPYCLTQVAVFQVQPTTGAYICPNCKTIIPRGYVEDTGTPRGTIGVVGFSGHGKTVYLTSLFSVLSRLSQVWHGFYYRSLDDFTHRVLYEQVPAFERGNLPESTPANFPNPALIHYAHLPVINHAYLAYYDTAGEVFTDTAQISRAGYFVAHADVVLFIVSLADCSADRLDDDLSRLLDTYIRAVNDHLKLDLRQRQRIVVTLTKADLLLPRMPVRLQEWLLQGGASWYVMNLTEKLFDLSVMSLEIEDWLRQDLGVIRFLNMLNDNFRGVRYTLVSATGLAENTAPPVHVADHDSPLVPIQKAALEPLRVLDPFWFVLDNTQRLPQTADKDQPAWRRWVQGIRSLASRLKK